MSMKTAAVHALALAIAQPGAETVLPIRSIGVAQRVAAVARDAYQNKNRGSLCRPHGTDDTAVVEGSTTFRRT